MKKFNYQYDYQFLSNWLNENKNIRRKNVMEVLEMSDYKTLQNWTEGKTIMPPSQMMRFCNYYSVPIECFFVNKVDVKYEIKERRPGDIDACYADPSYAYEKLGWKAEKDINEMCLDAYNFVKKD